MKNENDKTSTHGATSIGAGLLALLAVFGRYADDVARMGVNSIDDIGRACITSTDDVGAAMSRSSRCGGNVTRSVDDLRFQVRTPRIVVNESDKGASLAPRVAKEVAEATFRFIELTDGPRDE